MRNVCRNVLCPFRVVRLLAPFDQSDFWRFSIYIIKDGQKTVDMYAKYVFYVRKMYGKLPLVTVICRNMSQPPPTIAIKIKNRIVWALYVQFSGLERLTNTPIIHSVSHAYSHAKSSHCPYTHVLVHIRTRKALYICKIIYMEVFQIVFPPRFLFLSMST